MKIVYLLPLSLPLTRHVGGFTLKKVLDHSITAYYLTPSEKPWYRARCFFTLNDCEQQRSTKIAVEGKTHILVHNFSF
jgi:hypothetical protein